VPPSEFRVFCTMLTWSEELSRSKGIGEIIQK
jgi:hypothetical protein